VRDAIFAAAFARRPPFSDIPCHGSAPDRPAIPGRDRLDNAAAAPRPRRLIADIAVDWDDTTLNRLRAVRAWRPVPVWRFNGTKWEVRSGTAGANSLLDVEHNALAVDRATPGEHICRGRYRRLAFTGRRAELEPLENGLPDARSLTCRSTRPSGCCARDSRARVYEIPLS